MISRKLTALTLTLFLMQAVALAAPRDDLAINIVANPGFGGKIRGGHPFPVVVRLEALKEPMSLVVSVEVDNAAESIPRYTLKREIVPGTAYMCFLYPLCSSGTDEFTLRVTGADGKLWRDEKLIVRPFSEASYAVGILDARGIPGLYQREHTKMVVGLESVLLSADFMPTRAEGYSSADVLIWPSPDPSRLAWPSQRQAIREWVVSGGRLVIAPGAGWEASAKSFLAELLPGELDGVVEVADFSELEKIGGRFDTGKPMAVSRLRKITGEILLTAGAVPLVVRHDVGFGEVIFLAFDPTKSPFRGWNGCDRFWNWLFELESDGEEPLEQNEDQYGYSRGYYGGGGISDNLIGMLNKFPKVRPISFAFVVLFLVVYVLLIGPVDYLLLKRLKHLEWTWFTFPAVAIIATLVAFWAVSSSRTVQVYVNQFSVEDWSADGQGHRQYSFATLLSPKNRYYDVTFAAPNSSLYLMQGRGMGFRAGLAMSRPFVLTSRAESGGIAEELLIPVWSSRTFSGSWQSAEAPSAPLAADLRLDGARLKGEITNNTDAKLLAAFILHESGVYRIGEMNPDETKRVVARPQSSIDKYISDNTNPEYQRGDNRARSLLSSTFIAASLMCDGRYSPTDFYGNYMREDFASGQELAEYDLDSGFTLRRLLDSGHAVLVGLSEGVSRPLDVGKNFPERWERTLYRVCVDIGE